MFNSIHPGYFALLFTVGGALFGAGGHHFLTQNRFKQNNIDHDIITVRLKEKQNMGVCNERHNAVTKVLSEIQADVKWLVRKQNGGKNV